MGAVARVLSWIRRVPDVLADGAVATGPVAWIRADDGGVTKCRTREVRTFKIFVGGIPHEHVETADDGTWIYAARPY